MTSRKMILHIITGLDDGGAEAVLYRLCKADQSNVHVVISLSGPGKYGSLLRDQGVQVHCLELKKSGGRLAGLWRLYVLSRDLSPAAIQTWMYHANLIGGLAGCLAGVRRVFWGIHHTALDLKITKRHTIYVSRACAILSYIIPERIIFCANEAMKAHTEAGYNPKRTTVIPNGYDLSLFRPNLAARREIREELGIGHDSWVIGNVARYSAEKDHSNLIAALRVAFLSGMAEFTCVLVGSGIDAENVALKRLIDTAGLQDRIRLLGQRSDIPKIMAALDIHVLSSFSEAFPNVLCEAMACETPCISTNVGDAADIISDTGWVVPPRNSELLGGAILEAFMERSEPVWLDRRRRARSRIEINYEIGAVLNRYKRTWLDSTGIG